MRGYRIEAVLGYGGYGVVYRARHEELGYEVAIKEYLPVELSVREAGTVYPRSADCMQVYEDGKRRFLEEAKRIVQFKTDPGVVTCTDFFRANGTAYLVMEYIDGLSLAALLQQRETAGRAFDEDDLKSVAVPLLETLLRLHRVSVLHRDIKPSNILIRRSGGQPVLIDFGAAKQMTADYTKSAAPYTEGYAAFEQVGEGELGPWTDVYAFGAVLWRMVAGGKPPWEPPNPKRVELRAASALAGKPDSQPSAAQLGVGRFSEELLAAVDRSLTISDDKRPRDLEDLRHALNGPSQSGDMSEPPLDPVSGRRSNAQWRLWAAVGTIMAPAMFVLGIALVVDRPTSDRAELLESDVSTNERVRSESVPVEQLRSGVPPASTAQSPESIPKSSATVSERLGQGQVLAEDSPSGVSCLNWGTEEFFARVTVEEISRCLLDGSVKVNARLEDGSTPLQWAAAYSDTPEVVKALLAAGADVNTRDGWSGGRTPLHLAAANSESPEVVNILLDAGANPVAKDGDGKIPWDYAKENVQLKATGVYERLNEDQSR